MSAEVCKNMQWYVFFCRGTLTNYISIDTFCLECWGLGWAVGCVMQFMGVYWHDRLSNKLWSNKNL